MLTTDHVGWQKIIKNCATAVILTVAAISSAQQNYDNFDGERVVNYFTPRNWGQLDTLAVNPAPDLVNNSGGCAHYKRSRQRYDYIKIYPGVKMAGVEAYASHDPGAPRMKLKVYTTAPAGSLVEIQLGKQDGNAYPQGTHSQYQAFTSVSGAWEELEFKFSQVPKGSETRGKEVDQMTLLFLPGTSKSVEFYFDELTGPELYAGKPTKEGRKKDKKWFRP